MRIFVSGLLTGRHDAIETKAVNRTGERETVGEREEQREREETGKKREGMWERNGGGKEGEGERHMAF